MKIPTTDADGRYNGYIVPIWNALEEPGLSPDQVLLKVWNALEELELRPDQMDLSPIRNAFEEPRLRPSQVYLTAATPHSRKGPHLHMKRRGLFCCVRGNVHIVTQQGKLRTVRVSGELSGHELIEVPPGIPAAIYNDGDEAAFVLNMPSPPWSKEDPDDWPVEGWLDKLPGSDRGASGELVRQVIRQSAVKVHR